VQDLVGVGVADAGDQRLIGQRPLELPAAAGQEPAEGLLVGLERVRPEPDDPGHLGRRTDDVDRQPLAGALLGQVEALPVVEMDAHRQWALARLGRGRR
jgi:hypothetical protein